MMSNLVKSKFLENHYQKSPYFSKEGIISVLRMQLEAEVSPKSPLLRCDREELIARRKWYESHPTNALSAGAIRHLSIQILKIDSLLGQNESLLSTN